MTTESVQAWQMFPQALGYAPGILLSLILQGKEVLLPKCSVVIEAQLCISSNQPFDSLRKWVHLEATLTWASSA